MKTETPQSFIDPVFQEGSEKPSHYVLRAPDLILLNSDETACIFNTTPSALTEWRRNGIIPYVRIRGHLLYRLTDIMKTIDQFTFRNDKILPQK